MNYLFTTPVKSPPPYNQKPLLSTYTTFQDFSMPVWEASENTLKAVLYSHQQLFINIASSAPSNIRSSAATTPARSLAVAQWNSTAPLSALTARIIQRMHTAVMLKCILADF